MSQREVQLNKANKKDNVIKTVYGLALFLLFVICTVLFRRMAISYLGPLGTYYSDINVRLDWGMGECYSIFLIPEFYFVELFGMDIGSWLIGIYLSIFVIGTVLLIYALLRKICPNAEMRLLAIFSFVCLLVNPIFIPTISERLFSPYAGSVWHNESYLGMRFAAIMVLLLFFSTCNLYLEKFSWKVFIVESVLFLLVNWVKPNFIIAFGPAMLIMMIVDICKAKGKHFVRWMLYGIPVLIGGLILPVQYLLLFPSSGGGNDGSGGGNDGSGIAFVFGDFFFSQKLPLLNLILAYSFPVLMFIIHRKEFIKSKFHIVCCLGWFFSFAEFFFLSETGFRRLHENFYWGVRFFTFLIYCLSIGYFISDIQKSRKQKKNKAIDLFFVENMFVLIHLLAGVVYFVLVLLGVRASEL